MSSSKGDLRSPSFWIGHLVIIVATVVGVYLAANQGFKLAMEVDVVKGEKNNYYLRSSLKHELAANVGYVREYIAKVQNQTADPVLQLETFVWRTMTYSPSTLETPPELLREAQKFYHRVDEIMGTSFYNLQAKARHLGELADHVEQKVLPRLEENIAGVKRWLDERNVAY